MIITRLTADNVYNFQDFELDLTYPRKNPQSFIDDEYLEEVPSFKFKRVCILMGTNASGKTSIGKLLLDIQWLIRSAETEQVYGDLKFAINDQNKNAKISVEYLYPEINKYCFLSIDFDIFGKITEFEYKEIILSKKDTNITAKNKLDLLNNLENKDDKKSKFKESYNQNENDFYFIIAHNFDFPIYSLNMSKDDVEKLSLILKSFDNSIDDVKPLVTELDDGSDSIFEGYTVFFKNSDSVKVIDKGTTFSGKGKNRFSKGTYDFLSITDFLFHILRKSKESVSTIYFLDEKLASSHSELEISILNLIITKLNRYSQFFYTTHNYDVLDLNLPSHSFVFLHKEHGYTKVEQPEKLGFSKNDRNLKGYVRNNYFRTIPSTSAIDDLMWDE